MSSYAPYLGSCLYRPALASPPLPPSSEVSRGAAEPKHTGQSTTPIRVAVLIEANLHITNLAQRSGAALAAGDAALARFHGGQPVVRNAGVIDATTGSLPAGQTVSTVVSPSRSLHPASPVRSSSAPPTSTDVDLDPLSSVPKPSTQPSSTDTVASAMEVVDDGLAPSSLPSPTPQAGADFEQVDAREEGSAAVSTAGAPPPDSATAPVVQDPSSSSLGDAGSTDVGGEMAADAAPTNEERRQRLIDTDALDRRGPR